MEDGNIIKDEKHKDKLHMQILTQHKDKTYLQILTQHKDNSI